jgi:threonine dehydratase
MVNQSVPGWLAGGIETFAASSDLKLVGVVAQGAAGIALVQQAGKRAQVLHVGQSLADGTQLKSVQSKTATLLVNGEPRTLTLESAKPTSAGIAMNNAAPAYVPMPDVNAAVAQQMQLLQQAASNEAPAALNEAPNVAATKKRLGIRP